MNRSEMLNGGAYSTSARSHGNTTGIAASTGDNTEANGAWIDRMVVGHVDDGIVMSAKLIVSFTSALAFGETLSFNGNFQDADDIAGAGAADYGAAFAAFVVATGESGGSTETGTAEIDVGLDGARRFVRAQVTGNLSRSGTDTFAYSAVFALYGGHNVLISKSPVTIATP